MVGCMKCDQIGAKIKVKTYTSLEKANASQNAKNLTWHYMLTFWEQVVAIIPISLLQVSETLNPPPPSTALKNYYYNPTWFNSRSK